MTIIAFIGSVFSPYYAASRQRDPFNHCAFNIALYGPRGNRWAMTERPAHAVSIGDRTFRIGANRLEWKDRALVIDIDESTAPIPSRLRGRVTVAPSFTNTRRFTLDPGGRHRWRPIAPVATISLDFEKPSFDWRGHGYFDMNEGDEPLEQCFRSWNWSRARTARGGAAIHYDTERWNGETGSIALEFDSAGGLSTPDSPPTAPLTPTPLWRMTRMTRADAGSPARVLRTLEDTPFYSRSIIETAVGGEALCAMHESFSGARLRSPIVKAMLGFRMLRLAR